MSCSRIRGHEDCEKVVVDRCECSQTRKGPRQVHGRGSRRDDPLTGASGGTWSRGDARQIPASPAQSPSRGRLSGSGRPRKRASGSPTGSWGRVGARGRPRSPLSVPPEHLGWSSATTGAGPPRSPLLGGEPSSRGPLGVLVAANAARTLRLLGPPGGPNPTGPNGTLVTKRPGSRNSICS
jgi:hypothetical protein